MGWGPSRVRDVRRPPATTFPVRVLRFPKEFLFYQQKECDLNDDPGSSGTPWAQMIRWVDQIWARSLYTMGC